jgi:multisubunit Na+/H+ antiporter MnhF subunit
VFINSSVYHYIQCLMDIMVNYLLINFITVVLSRFIVSHIE